jgi:hypothetical protein
MCGCLWHVSHGFSLTPETTTYLKVPSFTGGSRLWGGGGGILLPRLVTFSISGWLCHISLHACRETKLIV